MSNAEPPPISVLGGAGGQQAVTEDLEAAVAVLRDVAQDLREAHKALVMARYAYEDAHPRALPEVAPYVWDVAEATADAQAGPGGPGRLETEAEDVAARLAAVTRAFLDAEQAAQHRLSVADRARRAVGDLAAGGAWAGRSATAAWWRASAHSVLPRLLGRDVIGDAIAPDYSLPTTGTANRRSVESRLAALRAAGVYDPLRIALVAMARAMEVRLGEPPLVDVASRSATDARPLRSLSDIGDLLVHLDATHPREVTVDKVVGADGRVSWIVVIPGTGDAALDGAEVMDLVSDGQSVDGAASDATALVLAAMAEAGVGADEPVLLAGHSLGGIVATAVAGAEDVPYSIRAVITAGSPTGDIVHDPEVAYLHLENESDLVPALEGRPNPQGPSVTTAVWDPRAGGGDAADRSRTLIGAHEAATYATGLRLLDRSKATSVVAWRQDAQEFFQGERSSRTVVSQVHGTPAVGGEKTAAPARSRPAPAVPRVSLGGIPELRP